MKSRVFLLSPANCRGLRAQQVLSPKAAFPVAARLRSEGVPIGELFAHMSGLYFRGKITYAQAFGRAFVITPDSGLVPAEQSVTSQVLIRFADAEISLENPELPSSAGTNRSRPVGGSGQRCAVRAARECRVGKVRTGAGRRLWVSTRVSRSFRWTRRHESGRPAVAGCRFRRRARVCAGYWRGPAGEPSTQAGAAARLPSIVGIGSWPYSIW